MLDRLLGERLLVKPVESKQDQAGVEADRCKKLMGALRYLYRNSSLAPMECSFFGIHHKNAFSLLVILAMIVKFDTGSHGCIACSLRLDQPWCTCYWVEGHASAITTSPGLLVEIDSAVIAASIAIQIYPIQSQDSSKNHHWQKGFCWALHGFWKMFQKACGYIYIYISLTWNIDLEWSVPKSVGFRFAAMPIVNTHCGSRTKRLRHGDSTNKCPKKDAQISH